MRRFFVEAAGVNGEEVALSEEESHHIVKVLRLPVGSEFELLDGRGGVYRAQLLAHGRRVAARIVAPIATAGGAGRLLTVYQAILKGEKMDTVVQKCTELGVSRLVPVRTKRCQGGKDDERDARRLERWRRIGVAACKQCLRPVLMDIAMPLAVADLASHCQAQRRLLFWEEERELPLRGVADWGETASAALFFGPEGGLAGEEVELLRGDGWVTVSLGERILRAETATLGAVAIVQYLLENL